MERPSTSCRDASGAHGCVPRSGSRHRSRPGATGSPATCSPRSRAARTSEPWQSASPARRRSSPSRRRGRRRGWRNGCGPLAARRRVAGAGSADRTGKGASVVRVARQPGLRDGVVAPAPHRVMAMCLRAGRVAAQAVLDGVLNGGGVGPRSRLANVPLSRLPRSGCRLVRSAPTQPGAVGRHGAERRGIDVHRLDGQLARARHRRRRPVDETLTVTWGDAGRSRPAPLLVYSSIRSVQRRHPRAPLKSGAHGVGAGGDLAR